MEKYRDPNDPLNGEKYHTGKPCVEGCGRPAGTAWSKFWCQPCNAARMDGIGDSLKKIHASMTPNAGNHGPT